MVIEYLPRAVPTNYWINAIGILLNGSVESLTPEHIASIQAANETMASGALRVLAMAYKDIDYVPDKNNEAHLEDRLVFHRTDGNDKIRPEKK